MQRRRERKREEDQLRIRKRKWDGHGSDEKRVEEAKGLGFCLRKWGNSAFFRHLQSFSIGS